MKKKYAQSHVIQNLYDIRSSVEHIRYKKIKICNLTFRVPLTSKVWAKDTLEINGNLNGLVTTFLPIFFFPFNKDDILKNVVWFPLTWMKTESCLIINILQNIVFFCVQQKKESHRGLKWHEGEKFNFRMDYHFNMSCASQ